MSQYVIELVASHRYVIEYANGTGPQGPSGSGGSGSTDVLSYASAQELTLTQLRTARRNLIQGSAPTITYDGNARVSKITYSDGSIKTLTYDGNGRLSQSNHVYSSPTRTYRKTMAYDGNGRLQSITEALL